MGCRRNRSPEEESRREKIRELPEISNVSSMENIQALFRDIIAEFMEDGLDSELDEELGYGRYDYAHRSTDNSRNGYSSKTLYTSFGDVDVSILRDRKGEFDPQLLKKNQTSVTALSRSGFRICFAPDPERLSVCSVQPLASAGLP